jgi:hypothetical protein
LLVEVSVADAEQVELRHLGRTSPDAVPVPVGQPASDSTSVGSFVVVSGQLLRKRRAACLCPEEFAVIPSVYRAEPSSATPPVPFPARSQVLQSSVCTEGDANRNWDKDDDDDTNALLRSDSFICKLNTSHPLARETETRQLFLSASIKVHVPLIVPDNEASGSQGRVGNGKTRRGEGGTADIYREPAVLSCRKEQQESSTGTQRWLEVDLPLRRISPEIISEPDKLPSSTGDVTNKTSLLSGEEGQRISHAAGSRLPAYRYPKPYFARCIC